MNRLVAALASCGCALLAPAAASAAPAPPGPVFVDSSPHTVANCSSPEQSAWSFVQQTAPFGAPYAGGIVRLTFNQPMAYAESHPDLYTDTPLTLADFSAPAGTVLWSFASRSDTGNRVSVPFVCPAQGVGAFDVRMDFFTTPAPPVTYGGHGARGHWSLLVFRVDEPSVVSIEASGAPLAYRFDDAASPTQVAAPAQPLALGTVSAGEHGIFVSPQADTVVDWAATLAVASSGGPSGGYGTGAEPGPTTTNALATTTRPVLRKRPRIVGIARVGRSVRCDRGTFAGATRYTTRWLRGGKAIAGRTGSTYRLRRADRGRLVACQVRAMNAGGATTVRSAAVRVRRAA